LGASVAAAFGLDLLWPVLLLTGVEVVRVSPNDTAFTHLAFESYPWSHSLLMVLVWSVLAGLVAKRFLGSTRIAVIVGALVWSHWALDLVTHRPDLPLWPGGPLVGLGLWRSVPATIAVEGMLLVIGVLLYVRTTSAKDKVGSLGFYGLVVLCTALWISQPWAPLPPSAAAVAWGGLALWLLPFWSQWVDNHRAIRHAS
jgi:membrane-bound metal-dependent hydrolase YbcI (DUF457 family)